MANKLKLFEQIARNAFKASEGDFSPVEREHPFESHNIHPKLPAEVRDLFDNGHFSQATFEAFKFLDKEVQRHSAMHAEIGKALMMSAFNELTPKIKLNSLTTISERNEQEGFKFIFAGGVLAIRNPRGHEYSVVDDPDTCLDHLSLASMLIRRLAASGFR